MFRILSVRPYPGLHGCPVIINVWRQNLSRTDGFLWFSKVSLCKHGLLNVAGNPRGTWPFTAPEAAWPCGRPWDLAKADVLWRIAALKWVELCH